MDLNTLFMIYSFFGFLIFLFNKKIAHVLYNLVLYFTNRLHISDVFIFRIDDKNRNSMFFLMRSFTILFGLAIISSCLYQIFY